jgi:methionyl-tRNA synthetase
MTDRIFIGVAWPYANGPMHLGTLAGCLLPADIFARYHRLKGDQVLMVSGSDEHGTPITIKAEKEGVSPQVIVDRYHKQHTASLKKLGIVFENFTRTSNDFHKKIVQDMFVMLYEKGYIYPKKMEVFYCLTCKRFLPDRYVVGKCPRCGGNARGDQCDCCGKTMGLDELVETRCSICGKPPEIREALHLFFKLSHFENQLDEWLSDKDFWKPNVLNFSRNWIKEGLQDRAISRDLEWGISIPLEGFTHQCIYVWFEAVIGYFSASQEWADLKGEPEQWKEWWNETAPAKHYYFLAKDNIPFHSIIWPAILMGYDNLQLPYDIPANEYLTLSGEQFSKSKGFGIWLPEILQRLNPDAIRYYLSINMPEKHDTDWSWKDFIAKTNNELVNTYGNFVHRVLVFTHKNFGVIPPLGDLEHSDTRILEEMHKTADNVASSIHQCHFKQGIKECMKLAQAGNKYFNDNAPWKLITDNPKRCQTVLHICLKILKALAILTTPYMPHQASQVWKMLGYDESIDKYGWDAALKDLKQLQIHEPVVLFKKIDDDSWDEDIKKDKFSHLDLRLAEITQVKKHPQSDSLYVLSIRLEKKKRIIVAGIKKWYKPDELVGKKAVVLTNIAPAAIKGTISQGMLIAAQGDKTCTLVTGKGNPGDSIFIQTLNRKPKSSLELKDFQKLKITTDKKGYILYKKQRLQTKKGYIYTDKKIPEGSRII